MRSGQKVFKPQGSGRVGSGLVVSGRFESGHPDDGFSWAGGAGGSARDWAQSSPSHFHLIGRGPARPSPSNLHLTGHGPARLITIQHRAGGFLEKARAFRYDGVHAVRVATATCLSKASHGCVTLPNTDFELKDEFEAIRVGGGGLHDRGNPARIPVLASATITACTPHPEELPPRCWIVLPPPRSP